MSGISLSEVGDILPHLIAVTLSIIAVVVSIRRILVSRRGRREVEGMQ